MKLTAPLLLLAAVVAGHMEMSKPAPLRSKYNPHTAPGDIDYDMPSPLSADGSDFPCRGSLGLLGTDEAAAVATYATGATYAFTLAGSTTHRGGSCQASLSVDGGRRFVVLASYIGGCPSGDGASYDFALPPDTPLGPGALFAWTWFNNEGNREMYMNCAVVDVVRGDGSGSGGGSGVSFGARPSIFVANVGNGVCTYEGTDVDFPDPGPDVVRDSDRPHAPGAGTCETYGGGGDRARRRHVVGERATW